MQDAWKKLQAIPCDFIVANDLASLTLAQRLAERHGAPLLLDVHECEPQHFEGQPLFDFILGLS